MTEKRIMNCITCPIGCEMTIIMKNNQMVAVTGNACPRGEKYAKEELTAPKRMLTATVSITGGHLPLLPVVSQSALPKGKILDCITVLRAITVQAPVKSGDVICPDILGLGVNIIASRTVESLS